MSSQGAELEGIQEALVRDAPQLTADTGRLDGDGAERQDGKNRDKSIPGTTALQGQAGRQPGLCSGDLQSSRPDCFAQTRCFYGEGEFAKYVGFWQPGDEAQEREEKKRQTKQIVPRSRSKNLSQPHEAGEHADRRRHRFVDKQWLPWSKGHGPAVLGTRRFSGDFQE